MGGLIVHEWLEPRGGAERVVDAMCDAFPDAELLALWNDDSDRYPHAKETWLAGTPLRHHKALALPFEPFAWRSTRQARGDYDWALVSSHLFAHQVRARNTSDYRVPKYVYVHTPARYIWAPELDSRGSSLPLRLAGSMLKPVDRHLAKDALRLAANSEFVRQRIQHAWHRDADVLYPPVDVHKIGYVQDWREQIARDERPVLDGIPAEFVLGASRFVPYKRLDLVIAVGEALGIPVVLAGSGPNEKAIKEAARSSSVPVTFVDNPSDPLLYALYQLALLFVFPPVEDFGIMPVEAASAGCPVLVNRTGGAAEIVTKYKTGAIADFACAGNLREAAIAAIASRGSANLQALLDLDRSSFVKRIKNWVCPAGGHPMGLVGSPESKSFTKGTDNLTRG